MPHIIKINGIIGWEVDIENVREQLAEANGQDITVEIASPGGMISEGLLIYNELKNYQGNVDTHLTGSVASMAAYIAMVGKYRTAENNAIFMIHNGSGLAIGDHRAMFKFGTHLDSLTNIIAKEYALKSENELSAVRAAMDETTFYYGDEIKEAGFVHEMVGEAEPEDRAEAVAMAELMIEECHKKVNTPELVKKDMAALSIMMADEPVSRETPTTVVKIDGSAITKEIDKLTNMIDGAEIKNIKAKTAKILKEVQLLKQKQADGRINVDFSSMADITENKIKNQQTQEVTIMNLAELKEKHPELYKEIVALGLTEGVAQERARVKTLVEMRAKFPKAHSQNVIDQAITDGHDLNQVSINLMSADQVAAEVAAAKADKADPPGNGADDVPEMKDGIMTHPDHVDSVGAEIAALPGVM